MHSLIISFCELPKLLHRGASLVTALNDCGCTYHYHEAIHVFHQSVYLSHYCTLHVQDQPPPPELKPPLTLIWRRGKDMPFRMGDAVQSVVLGNKVYIGGGGAGSDRNDCTVMVYDIMRDQCSTLPQYNAKYFAMTSLDNLLVVAGGVDRATRKTTNQIAVFESMKWTCPYPPMNIARSSSTAVSFNNHIVVAGGYVQGWNISSVEVLDITSNWWSTADPLPGARSMMKSAMVGDMWYLMGGWDHTGNCTKVVHRVNIRELSGKAISMATCQATPNPLSLWQTIPDTPHFFSSPLVINRALLAVGGRDDRFTAATSIRLYQPGSWRWVKVGDLPTARYYCTSSVLPNGEVLVAGGNDESMFVPYLNRVDLLTVIESS